MCFSNAINDDLVDKGLDDLALSCGRGFAEALAEGGKFS